MESSDPSSEPVERGWSCQIQDGWEVKVVSEDFDQRLDALTKDADKLDLVHSLENLTKLCHGQKVLVMSITGWVFGMVMLRGTYFSGPHVESCGSIWIWFTPWRI